MGANSSYCTTCANANLLVTTKAVSGTCPRVAHARHRAILTAFANFAHKTGKEEAAAEYVLPALRIGKGPAVAQGLFV